MLPVCGRAIVHARYKGVSRARKVCTRWGYSVLEDKTTKYCKVKNQQSIWIQGLKEWGGMAAFSHSQHGLRCGGQLGMCSHVDEFWVFVIIGSDRGTIVVLVRC